MPLSTFGKYDSSLLFILTWNEFTVTLKYILKIVLTTNALSINKYNPHKNQSSKKSLTIKLEWDLCLTESIYRTCKRPYLSISQSLAIILMSVLKWSTNIIDFLYKDYIWILGRKITEGIFTTWEDSHVSPSLLFCYF